MNTPLKYRVDGELVNANALARTHGWPRSYVMEVLQANPETATLDQVRAHVVKRLQGTGSATPRKPRALSRRWNRSQGGAP